MKSQQGGKRQQVTPHHQLHDNRELVVQLQGARLVLLGCNSSDGSNLTAAVHPFRTCGAYVRCRRKSEELSFTLQRQQQGTHHCKPHKVGSSCQYIRQS